MAAARDASASLTGGIAVNIATAPADEAERYGGRDVSKLVKAACGGAHHHPARRLRRVPSAAGVRTPRPPAAQVVGVIGWSSPASSAAARTCSAETKSIPLSTATPTCAETSALIRWSELIVGHHDELGGRQRDQRCPPDR